MVCGCSGGSSASGQLKSQNKEIERMLKQARKDGKKECKLLLLGAGNSGKCLAPGTEILMDNGDVRPVEAVMLNSYLLDDATRSVPVLGTTCGKGEMFSVEPVNPIYGNGFKCNDRHVLVLRHGTTGEELEITTKQYFENKDSYAGYGLYYNAQPISFNANDSGTPPMPQGVTEEILWCYGALLAANETDPTLSFSTAGPLAARGDHITAMLTGAGLKHKATKTDISVAVKDLSAAVTPLTNEWGAQAVPKSLLVATLPERMAVVSGVFSACSTSTTDSEGSPLVNLTAVRPIWATQALLTLVRSTGHVIGTHDSSTITLMANLTPPAPTHPIGATPAPPLAVPLSVTALGEGDYVGFQVGGSGRFLLGSGMVSHNSTIFKQMKIIHQRGYTREESMRFRAVIHANLIHGMKVLLQACTRYRYTFTDPDNKARAEYVNAIDEADPLTPELAEVLGLLWADPIVQSAYARRSELQLPDSTDYYFANLARIAVPGYLPTEQDILRSRVKTSGIIEMDFDQGGLHFKMIDVGGQRNERRKWVHVFDDVTAVIFVVAVSEYDQQLQEDESQNRMKEAMLLFDEVCNSRWFRDTSIILFFNKDDLFQQKIRKSSITTAFPGYKGPQEYKAALAYIKRQFIALNRSELKEVIPYSTCATDTGQVKKVFDAVREIIQQANLRAAGIL